MATYSYTIIIPHRNTPELLQRLLETIPQRDDVQTIIVDDHSNKHIVDFAHFPGCSRAHTEVYFSRKRKGAGHARNIGLDHAQGKWLIFADADDLFPPHFGNLLDRYADADADTILFNAQDALSSNLSQPGHRCRYIQKAFDRYAQSGNLSELRYVKLSPWGQFFRREQVSRLHLRFSETRYCNDILFVASANIYARKFLVVNEVAYIATEHEKSISASLYSNKKTTLLECHNRFGQHTKVHLLFEKNAIPPDQHNYKTHIRRYIDHYPLCFAGEVALLMVLHPKTGIFVAKYYLRRLRSHQGNPPSQQI